MWTILISSSSSGAVLVRLTQICFYTCTRQKLSQREFRRMLRKDNPYFIFSFGIKDAPEQFRSYTL